MLQGIDVSNWQAYLDIKELPIDFCIVKATEGTYFVDKYCDGFVQDCINIGLHWGFYHFANNNEPESEAEFFYRNCENYFNKGIPVLDYETSNADNVEWCERFMSKVHDLSGVWPMLYISAGRCGEYEGSWLPSKCGLWVAGYPYTMTSFNEAGKMPYNIYPWSFAAIWQFTSSLELNGWKLDGNIAYMDADAWAKYANASDSPQPDMPHKNVDDLVRETLLGKYGTGEDRRKLLNGDYERVQERINELYNVADAVIRGEWGNGWNRENALNGAGYPYDIVQRIVNEKLA